MKASFPIHDPGYGALHDAVSVDYFDLGDAVFPKRSDVVDVVVGKLASHERDAGRVSVQEVSQSRDPFEIVDRVVNLVEIDVVDFGKVGGIWDESQRHQAVDLSISGQRPDLHPNVEIPSFAYLGIESSSPERKLVFRCGARLTKASHSAKVADLIEFAEPINGDGSPFLNCRDSHAAGFPSARTSSEIKSPSRATTFGGFAFYNAMTAFTQGGLSCR